MRLNLFFLPNGNWNAIWTIAVRCQTSWVEELKVQNLIYAGLTLLKSSFDGFTKAAQYVYGNVTRGWWPIEPFNPPEWNPNPSLIGKQLSSLRNFYKGFIHTRGCLLAKLESKIWSGYLGANSQRASVRVLTDCPVFLAFAQMVDAGHFLWTCHKVSSLVFLGKKKNTGTPILFPDPNTKNYQSKWYPFSLCWLNSARKRGKVNTRCGSQIATAANTITIGN